MKLTRQQRATISQATATPPARGEMALPLAIDISHTPAPGVKVYYLPGTDVLVVGIYPTARKGTVYRWQDGAENPPVVIDWNLDGPPCR
jgi:hypothetical protein